MLAILFAAFLVLGPASSSSAQGANDEAALVAPGAAAATGAAEDTIPETPGSRARKEQIKELATTLRELAEAHGPDAVILQTKLLMKTLSSGALGVTEVHAPKPEPGSAGKALLYHVSTGVFFDSSSTTLEQRREQIWDRIAAPVLVEMASFNIEPGSLTLEFDYQAQDASTFAGGALDPKAESVTETVAFALAAEDLQAFLAKDLEAPDLRLRSQRK